MAAKILVIENEESTLQVFHQLSGALNIDLQILYNWGRNTKVENRNEIDALFVNVELNFIDLRLLNQQFLNPNNNEKQIPVFFLFSKSFNKKYLAAAKLPHKGELKKPIKAEDLFYALDSCLDLEKQLDYPERNYRDKLQQFRAYYAVTKELINKLEAYFE